MKKLLIALSALVSINCAAATQYVGSMTIITPDIATGHQEYSYSAISYDGDLMVCPKYDMYLGSGVCKDKLGNNRWTRLVNIVPPGKKYAGYSIHPTTGSIYVYYK